MAAASQLLLAYYGDDFTGSTDALESLSSAGVKTALFLEPPTRERLAAMPGLQALGVAGLTRSLPPEPMDAVLRPAFTALRTLGPRHVHYKVCSTFDSSPTVGSIGRAIDVGAEVFGVRYVPLVVGAPPLGRYCVFGNLFARLGIGSDGAIHRLDRHPAMSRHPVTPADEADLRVHLAKQTNKRIGLMDVVQVDLPPAEARASLGKMISEGSEIVLFDVMQTAQLGRIGALLDAGDELAPRFSVGSSAIEMALGAYWNEARGIVPRPEWPRPAAVERLLVVSGSCSPVTGGQIDWAMANGFAGVALDPHAPRIERAIAAAREALRAGKSVVVYTNRGSATGGRVASAEKLGAALGQIARQLLQSEKLPRLAIAGGDSSSYAARALGIEAVEMVAPLAPGAPLCRARAQGSPADGIEINFKGGQVGAPDYFGAVRRGSL